MSKEPEKGTAEGTFYDGSPTTTEYFDAYDDAASETVDITDFPCILEPSSVQEALLMEWSERMTQPWE